MGSLADRNFGVLDAVASPAAIPQHLLRKPEFYPKLRRRSPALPSQRLPQERQMTRRFETVAQAGEALSGRRLAPAADKASPVQGFGGGPGDLGHGFGRRCLTTTLSPPEGWNR